MAGALAGVRVLDLGRFIACPFCGMLMADLGAEVIRVERPGGGQDRFLGLLTPAGFSYGFSNQNRNKKAITLNYERDKEARGILNELIKRSDVVIENFSPSAVEALGITYENMKAARPDVIFAHVSGFGPDGPYSHRLGFDQVAKAMSGAMSVSGFPGPPTQEQVAHIDYMTATLTAVGVVSALYHRQATGEGQMVDTALLQTAVTLAAPMIAEWETGGRLREQTGNRRPWLGPSDTYKTKDGRWVVLAIITNSIWRRFCRFIGREELADDPRLQTDYDRWENREVSDPVVATWVAGQTAEEVIAAAEQIPIPCGLCHQQTEVAGDPQVQARKMLTEVPFPGGDGSMLVTGPPIGMSATPTAIERSFPAVGEHNEEVYGELLGYSREHLAALEDRGVV